MIDVKIDTDIHRDAIHEMVECIEDYEKFIPKSVARST